MTAFFSDAPYMRGAYFLRAVAERIGPDELDVALGVFARRYVGEPAHMSDLVTVIRESSGFDPDGLRRRVVARRDRPGDWPLP